ncbi:P-loop containing nucleoside triphosphate hydrolase protein, partial [Ochromonadaceae sp. CCMP2298]
MSASASGRRTGAQGGEARPRGTEEGHRGLSVRGSVGGDRQLRNTNFKVVIRVRPPLPRELNGDLPFQNIVAVDREQEITVSDDLDALLECGHEAHSRIRGAQTHTHSFVFDYVYDQDCTQREVYETTAAPVVASALMGYNATIFAYGQTGTGKTFTMEGFTRDRDRNSGMSGIGNSGDRGRDMDREALEVRGIIPRAIEQIFGHIRQHASARTRFLVRASYLQIYNETISDLLKPQRSNLTIREDKRRGVYVEGLSEWVVRSPAEIYGLMERGGAIRATGETKMNALSSRSHAVFIVIAEQSETSYVDDAGEALTPEFQKYPRGPQREQQQKQLERNVRQSFRVGKLNLVDLAGSERVRLSGATGQRLEESKQINRSLAALGNVISALTEAKSRAHIPYRDSKLTRMLEDSLGGNCKTTMMAMISPALEAIQVSIFPL